MKRLAAVATVVFCIGGSTGTAAQPASQDPEAFLQLGQRHYREGDLDAAVFALDTAVKKLSTDPSKTRPLVQAYVYLGATYVALAQEEQGKTRFRQALALDPSLRLKPDEFPPKVTRVFDSLVLEKTAAKKKKGAKLALILGGAGAAAAVGISAAASGGAPPNRPPTAAITVTPDGQAITGITTVTFTASSTDPDGDPLTYAWNLGDGGTASAATVTHRYATEGTFNVTLTVSDGRGLSTTASASLTARSLSGTWEAASFISGLLVWTQSGSGLTIRNADSANDRFNTWVGGSVADPRRVMIDVRFTFASQFDGRYVGEANSRLDQVTVVREGGSTSFTFNRR